MMRVELIEPKSLGIFKNGKSSPAIIVAPHGPDDDYTTDMAEKIADDLDCYAVINHGWEKSNQIDTKNDKGNCNSNTHLQHPVLYSEFLKPLLTYVSRIKKSYGEVEIFIIHGLANNVRSKIGSKDLDLILGTGLGFTPSLSLSQNRIRLLSYCLRQSKFYAWEGKEGGSYSGWTKENLNQYFRKWNYDDRVSSVQLEIIKNLREDKTTARITGALLADVLKEYIAAAILGDRGPNINLPRI